MVRYSERAGRGRPSFRYTLSRKGEQAAGTNYSELAKTLWDEIRAIDEPDIRRGLLKTDCRSPSAQFNDLLEGETLTERMESMASLMESRGMPCDFDGSGALPVLSPLSCPYPELAEKDRGVCSMERMFLAEVLGGDVSLAECRLDGGSCCSFEGIDEDELGPGRRQPCWVVLQSAVAGSRSDGDLVNCGVSVSLSLPSEATRIAGPLAVRPARSRSAARRGRPEMRSRRKFKHPNHLQSETKHDPAMD